MSSSRSSRNVRWALLGFFASALFVFFGLTILYRITHLEVAADIVWLGQQSLAPETPAAQRAWASGPDGRRLTINSARLSLRRDDRRAELFVFSVAPSDASAPDVLDVNFQVPAWPPGKARALLEMETEAGPLRMERELNIDPVIKGCLSMLSPQREWNQAPAGLATAPRGGREGRSGVGAPVAFQAFPLGGRLSQGKDELWLRALDRQRRSVAGRLTPKDGEAQEVDEEGFLLLHVGGPIGVHFESPQGDLEQRLELRREASPGRLRARPLLLRAGEDLQLRLAGNPAAGAFHWELWWLGGWAATGQQDFQLGGGDWILSLPPGLEGPLLIRLRGDAAGEGAAARAFAIGGRAGVPKPADAWRLLQLVPGEEGFWDEMVGLGRGPAATAALLSRLRGPDGPLPELGREHSKGGRSGMSWLGWILVGLGGLGLLLVFLFIALRRASMS